MITEALVADIVSAYVTKNNVSVADLPALIRSVHATLSSLGQPEVVAEAAELKPAVPIKKSVAADAITCLECGRKLKMLKRHITADHGLTVDEYRAKWGLPSDYPVVAPNYAKSRSDLAKSLGLGRSKKALSSGVEK